MMSKNKSNTIRPHHFLFSIVPGAVLILLLSASELPGLVTDPSIGARQNLEDLNLVQIDTLYGSRRVYTDMEYNYRVRVKDNATWPIRYDWTIDEEIQTSGNNIVHQFTRPGKYSVDVVVSNEYGRDSERIWVWVVDRTIVRPSVAASEAGGKNGPGLEEINTISVQLAPSDVITEGIYYSWAVETYLSRLSAQSATREYAQLGLSHVRVYEDDSGSGSTAFRVLLGRYGTQKQAVIRKKNLESLVERPLSLITIRG